MKGSAESSERADRADARGPRGRQSAQRYRCSALLAVLIATASMGLTACSDSTSPHVASLGKNTGDDNGRSSTTLTMGNPTRLLNEWAACMRRHGDPNQPDPTIDTNDDIDINWNPAITGGVDGTNKGGQGNSGPGQFCWAYLTAAQTALGGNQQPKNDEATLEKFSECMRVNGIADSPTRPTAPCRSTWGAAAT